MPPKQKSQPPPPGISLGETATRFLATISTESRNKAQGEVFKFVRWYGEERHIDTLTGPEVANYSEQYYISTTTSTDNLSFVKKFLAYAQKQGFVPSNLAAHIRIKKLSSKGVAGGSARAEEPVLLTGGGYTDLVDRLVLLKSERPKIAEEIRKAAADKDFRENAPLEAAREKLGHLEGQIRELEDTLKRAKVAEVAQESSLKASIGDIVTLEDKSTGDKVKLTLVGAREANVKQGKISIVSPMGQAMFNKEVGDAVNVNAPSGVISYSILDITRG